MKVAKCFWKGHGAIPATENVGSNEESAVALAISRLGRRVNVLSLHPVGGLTPLKFTCAGP
jgi:hypothetical protein